METTTLQNATIHSPAQFTFKSELLNAYSRQIAEIGADMASKNIQLAKILGKVKSEKAYETDGFKSVADYAEQTFGIKKASAYQLANVGERFYNADTETAKKVTAMLTPSNMAELIGMDDKEIDKAIEAGQISKESSQQSLRALAKAGKEPKVTIEYKYDVTVTAVTNTTTTTTCRVGVTLQSVKDVILAKSGFTNIMEKRFDGDKSDGVIFYLSAEGYFAKADYHKHTEQKPEPEKRGFTYDDVIAMLRKAAEQNGCSVDELVKKAKETPKVEDAPESVEED